MGMGRTAAVPSKRIEQPVLEVLSAGTCEGARFFLPAKQLDRKLYERTNDVLLALGGKWNRSAKAHVFGEDCGDLIDGAIETGCYTRPSDMGWFPTPAALAARIVELADVRPGMQVLEPSAGEGAIVRELQLAGADVYCIEIDGARAARLSRLSPWVLHQGDFLTCRVPQTFDRVVMNPPFAKRADIHHVLRARSLLRPDGLLVSIMSGGIAFREDRMTTEFRDQCETIEALPDESFRESGTDVRTVVVTMKAAS